MIDRTQLVNEMKRALDLPESYRVEIEEPICHATADEILDPGGFDLKLGRQVFHFNMRNNSKLAGQISRVDVIPVGIKNRVISAMISEENERRRAEEARRQAEARGEFNIKGVTFKMIRVKGGMFLMGSNSGFNDEQPVHEVRVNSFSIGQTQVTQELWEVVMGTNPSSFKGNKKPVENVSWNDCQTFIQKLNKLTGKQFRLPTEAEWEFAARGGILSKGCTFSGSDSIDEVAWYEDNSGVTTHDVGIKSPNELGIYDMSGNVWEWCQDWYAGDYYSYCVDNNPIGAASGSNRVNRGGGWYYNATSCRVANRGSYTPTGTYDNIGFRLAQ